MGDIIVCATHGPSEPVVACIHIVERRARDIFVVPPDDEDGCQAWCSECELARLADHGWYDAADAIAQWELICTQCYEAAVANAESITSCEGIETPDTEPPE